MDAVEAAYLSCSDRLGGLSLPAFRAAVSGAEIHPITRGGEVIGAVIVMGPEVHACVMSGHSGHWVSKRLLKVLADVVHRYGYATTQATTEAGHRFVKRLGFKPEGGKYVLRVNHGH